MTVSEYYSDRSEEHTVTVTLLNAEGDDIDSFFFDEDDDDYAIVSNLYSSARRKALRIDEALNTMLHELEHSEEVGIPPLPEPEDDLPF